MNGSAKGKFTGWHMTMILLAFFGVVVAVNFTMARLAVTSFGGTVVDNSYVASQNYNRWLANASKQDRLGWSVTASLAADRHVIVDAQKDGLVLDRLSAAGDALHPLGRTGDLALDFRVGPRGRLFSTKALPAGRWNIRVSLRRRDEIYKLSVPLQ